jgi:2'-5' RNA ligase
MKSIWCWQLQGSTIFASTREFHKRVHRLLFSLQPPTNVAFDHHSTMLRDKATIEEFKEMANEFEGGGATIESKW